MLKMPLEVNAEAPENVSLSVDKREGVEARGNPRNLFWQERHQIVSILSARSLTCPRIFTVWQKAMDSILIRHLCHAAIVVEFIEPI
jgi:hypothetical protein